ncbi:hypothetical protein [Novosphingobium sp. Chol11]|jgi:hypothetical protein|uniref:hypothetical protein n=1 Tax=Novosphingobium sp. Chol11 TaxID=1385763 RepID=UPI000BE2B179|nr:hypothetical protein [Novosphingobium sp. Chol11]
MRLLILAAAALSVATPALAQTAASPAPAHAAHAKLNTTDTELGVLLDNPAAKAIIEKHIPGMTANDQVDMARAMTLKSIQQYAPDDVTDARLAAIDADLAKLP